jgi:predicted Zn-dependent protease
MKSNCHLWSALLICLLSLITAQSVLAQRTQIKPGINAFSPQQDIELGRKAAQEVEQKMPMCNDPKVDAYLSKLGHRLIEHLNPRRGISLGVPLCER